VQVNFKIHRLLRNASERVMQLIVSTSHNTSIRFTCCTVIVRLLVLPLDRLATCVALVLRREARLLGCARPRRSARDFVAPKQVLTSLRTFVVYQSNSFLLAKGPERKYRAFYAEHMFRDQ
jgi:hypothetical protein